ncbi:MAG: hypothetical protein P1S46_12145 [bacterium]|nr:hypothetical protein [bacterium]
MEKRCVAIQEATADTGDYTTGYLHEVTENLIGSVVTIETRDSNGMNGEATGVLVEILD